MTLANMGEPMSRANGVMGRRSGAVDPPPARSKVAESGDGRSKTGRRTRAARKNEVSWRRNRQSENSLGRDGRLRRKQCLLAGAKRRLATWRRRSIVGVAGNTVHGHGGAAVTVARRGQYAARPVGQSGRQGKDRTQQAQPAKKHRHHSRIRRPVSRPAALQKGRRFKIGSLSNLKAAPSFQCSPSDALNSI